MVDLRSDGFQFFHDGGILVVAELEVRRLFAETDDFFGQGDAAFAAFCPDFGQSDVDAEFVALRFDEVEFGLGVGRERVDGDDDRETVDVLDVIDVLEQVRKTGFQSFEVFVVQVGFRDTAVVLEGTDGSDDDDGGGSKACHAALDVEELLGTEVGTEAGFRNGVVTELEGHLGGGDGVAAVSDVRERAAVDEGRSAFEGLNEVRFQSIFQKSSTGTLSFDVSDRDGLAVEGVGDDDAGQTGLEVGDVGSEAKNSHDLGRDGDVEAVLTRDALHAAAEAVDDISELTVVHVDRALPGDLLDVDAKSVALLDVVVEHGSDEVVGCADGVEVAGEVEVDIFHGNDLGISAAGRAAFDAEDRAEGRLTKSDDDVLADLSHAVRETDRRGGLAFAGGSRVDGGNKDQLAVRFVSIVLEEFVVDFCFVVAVHFEIFLVDAGTLRDDADVFHLTFLGDLDIGLEFSHGIVPP